MAIILGRMVTYLKGLLPIKSFNTLITWSAKLLGSYLWSHMTLWSRGLVISRKKLKSLYLHYHGTSGRLVINLQSLLTIKSYKILMMWSCKITWQTKTCISLLQECFLQPNLAGWWLILNRSSTKPHDLSIAWSCKITWQPKTIMFPIP